MTRKEQIEKAATEYINSDAVSPMNMQMAFGDFINGAMWADGHPNQQMIEQMDRALKDVYSMLNDMFVDYDDARLGIAYRIIDGMIEDLGLLIDEEE